MAAKVKRTFLQALQRLQGEMRDKLSETESEALMRFAIGIINRDYWDDVRGIGNEILRQIKEGELKDEVAVREAVTQDVDGSQRVIYTFQARLGMLATNNTDAWEDMGMENPTIEQQMFAAMEADVNAWLSSNDMDELLQVAQNGDED